jgi:hypothetical protein
MNCIMTIAIPSHLSDAELVAEVTRCAHDERRSTARLLAHLAELDARQLYLGAGHATLFAYCHHVLGLSEDAAYNRVHAARACRLFPQALQQLAAGELTVTTVRLLAGRLTADNHRELLAAAAHRSKREVEELLACHFPEADRRSSGRKVPVRTQSSERVASPPTTEPAQVMGVLVMTSAAPGPVLTPPETAPPRPTAWTHRPAVKPLAEDRYEVRFTASAGTRDKLKVAQDLLRHVIPNGDVAAIVDRALSALVEAHSRAKMAAVRAPAKARPVATTTRPAAEGSRHVPSEVKRTVWVRDGGRCAFVGTTGHRCRERAFLEYHHVVPYAAGGEATVANIQLRCHAHNGYGAEVFFKTPAGRCAAGDLPERATKPAVSWNFSPVPERPRRPDGRRSGDSERNR